MLVEFFRALGFEINHPDQFILHGTILFAPIVFGILAGAAKTSHHWPHFTNNWPKIACLLYAIIGLGLMFCFTWAGCIP